NGSDHILEVLTIFIEEIIPKKDFLLVGESFGGYLARGILSKMFERVNGLLLICPVVVVLQKERRLPDKQIIVQDKEFLNTLTSTERKEFSELAVVANEYTYKRFKEEIKP
ncbi:alpha/beta hydrolase, partial [Bacillus wiedmannii]